jgi:hypothetical protein
MVLNSNIPHFKALIKRAYLTKNTKDTEYDNIYVFGVQSVAGKILTFHVITDYGMVRSRVPISEIYTKECDNDIPFHFKQLWDCFSENVSVVHYDFLSEHRCQVILKDKSLVWANYLFTVDWYNNPYRDEPSDYKAGHILVSEDGYLLCMPNNRIYWKDSNWVTKDFPLHPTSYKVDTELLSVENQSDRWVAEDTDNYYYGIN